MSGYVSDCIIASNLTPNLSACCWSWDDLTAIEDHTLWRGVDVFHQAGAKVVMCYSNHAASTVFPSCRNPLKSAPRCVYSVVQCLYHLRFPIFWYMTLLFRYVGMYILEKLAAYIPSEDLSSWTTLNIDAADCFWTLVPTYQSTWCLMYGKQNLSLHHSGDLRSLYSCIQSTADGVVC